MGVDMKQDKMSSFEPEPDMAAVLDAIERGDTNVQAAARARRPVKGIRKVIADIEGGKEDIVHYREVQSLQLSSIQQRILSHLDDEDKMEQASLADLANTFGILKKNEQLLDGDPTEITGLVAYLTVIEKEEEAKKLPVGGSIIDVSEEDQEDIEETPNL